MSNWESNYDFSSNQSQGFYDPQMYNYDAGASDYSALNTVQQTDGKFKTQDSSHKNIGHFRFLMSENSVLILV